MNVPVSGSATPTTRASRSPLTDWSSSGDRRLGEAYRLAEVRWEMIAAMGLLHLLPLMLLFVLTRNFLVRGMTATTKLLSKHTSLNLRHPRASSRPASRREAGTDEDTDSRSGHDPRAETDHETLTALHTLNVRRVPILEQQQTILDMLHQRTS